MNKIIMLMRLGLVLFFGYHQSTKVEVTCKTTAIKVNPGYALTDDDSTFNYQGHKYFILTNETFDVKGNIIGASIAGDVGYSTYTQKDFIKYKNLLDDYSLTKVINVQLINNQRITVNGHNLNASAIDRINKAVYYNLYSKDTLYRLTYK